MFRLHPACECINRTLVGHCGNGWLHARIERITNCFRSDPPVMHSLAEVTMSRLSEPQSPQSLSVSFGKYFYTVNMSFNHFGTSFHSFMVLQKSLKGSTLLKRIKIKASKRKRLRIVLRPRVSSWQILQSMQKHDSVKMNDAAQTLLERRFHGLPRSLGRFLCDGFQRVLSFDATFCV